MATEGLPLLKAFRIEGLPLDRVDLGPDVTAVLSRILVSEYTETFLTPGPGDRFDVGLTVAEELSIGIVGLEGMSLVFGGASATLVRVGVETRPNQVKVILGAGARLRFPRSILKPVRLEGEEFVDDPARPFAEIAISAGIAIDQDWNVTFDGANAFRLDPAMIADSGVVVEGRVSLDLSESTGLPQSAALGLPATWKGVVFDTLTVHLPRAITDAVPIASIAFTNFHIGSGGVSGRIALNGNPPAGQLAGFSFAPTAFEIELRQNCLTAAELEGTLEVPFFDERIDVTVGFDLAGNFNIGVSAANGLVTLDKPGLLSLTVDGLGFSRRGDVFVVAISGSITPDVGGLEWPTIRVQSLKIDSDGNVRIEGGWLDLREQYVLDFYGFQLSITRIGFGTTVDGRRWIGFNGGLKLVDGLSAGASVEGMRITWDPSTNVVSFSLEGVGVEFEVPGVLAFKGVVSMKEPSPGVFRFDGDITLSLQTIGLEIEGQLVIGYNQPADYTFFAIYLGVELPAGIPLWSTGLALYGLAGLFALNMEPGRNPGEAWYAIQPAPSWYHRHPPGVGVAQLRKWKDAEGSFGFGAGVTVGTVADNGFTFAGRMLLAIVFPGPIVFIEGRANVLKERSSLRDEPVFRTLVVVDGREREVLVGLDAQYTMDAGAELIEIGGGVEAFFDFDNPIAWHLYLGIDEPRERRIRAELFFRIFEANSYFMIDVNRLRTGAWIGYEKSWRFGPLHVLLEAWIDGTAELSFKPVYFKGSLWLHGAIGASVFGFGFQLSADARIDVAVFDPFHVKAELSVSVDLPWPLPDFAVDITLEWGPDPTPPLLPVPLKEVAIGHEKVAVTWPLPTADSLLVPRIEQNTANAMPGFFENQPPVLASSTIAAAPPNNAPVVPLDARPDLTFGLAVHDDPLVGVNQHPAYPSGNPTGWVWVGDPSRNDGPVRMRPALTEIVLERWNGTAWDAAARAGAGANPAGVRALYGSWAPVADGDSTTSAAANLANTKLRVWSKTPFDYARRTGGVWNSWVTSAFPSYPCIDIPEDRVVCCATSDLEIGTSPAAPWRCDGNDVFAITWAGPPDPVVVDGHAVGAKDAALCFPTGTTFVVLLDEPVIAVEITVVAEAPRADKCVDLRGRRASRARNPRTEDKLVFTGYAGGSPVGTSEIRQVALANGTMITGLDVEEELFVELPVPANFVELLVSTSLQTIDVDALGAAMKVLGRQHVQSLGVVELVTFSPPADAEPITTVRIHALERGTAFVHQVCSSAVLGAAVVATAYGDDGTALGQYELKDGRIDVPGRHVRMIVVGSDVASFCLFEVCARAGLSAADRLGWMAQQQHVVDELARWSTDGEVLRPWSQYRLRISTKLGVALAAGSQLAAGFAGDRSITQIAYFRTQGPPGLAQLSPPLNRPVPSEPSTATSAPPFESGLEDLSRYVAQTVPPTVPERAGDPPRLPKPVYRGYDVGVRFNETYVDEMYALAGRDLALYLYDNNENPVRDANGRVLSPPNRWGRVDSLSGSVTDTERAWLTVLSSATCTTSMFDLGTVARDVTLGRDGFVFDPETLYEARLTPLLAHESWSMGLAAGASVSGPAGTLRGATNEWAVTDVGSVAAPSTWTVREAGSPPARFIEQTSNISSGASARNSAFPGGTFLTLRALPWLVNTDPDQPARWTDYRLSLYVRSSDDDIVGAGVRVGGGYAYVVMLDRERDRRRLVRLRPADAAVLAEAPGGYVTGVDTHVSIEAVGPRLRVHLDGRLVFDVEDAAINAGSIALYSADNAGARFTDVSVDDLRHTAPTLYRFPFTTSRFSDFRHHLGSGTDRVFSVDVASGAPLTHAAGVSVTPSSAVAPATEPEARHYDAVAVDALGAAARSPVPIADVTRVVVGAATRGIIVRTAEPIDWTRTSLTVTQSTGHDAPMVVEPARLVKLVRVTFAAATPATATAPGPAPGDESATLLLHDAVDPSGLRIERRTLPTPVAAGAAVPTDGAVLAEPDLITNRTEGGREPVVAWRPAVVDLSEVDIVVPPGTGSPQWSATNGVLSQRGSFWGLHWPWTIGAASKRIGTLAMARATLPTDLRLTFDLTMTTGSKGGAGAVFRYRDGANHYRFSIDPQTNRQSLVKFAGGALTVVWQGTLPAASPATHAVVVEAVGDQLRVTVDGSPVGQVTDASHRSGRAGFYSYGSSDASFSGVTVHRLERRVGDWRIDDAAPAGAAPSSWSIEYGMLRKVAASPATATAASYAVLTAGAWSDVEVTTVLALPPGAQAGVVLRYASPEDHDVLLFDRGAGRQSYRQRVGGVDSERWGAPLATTMAAVSVRVEAVGTRVRGWVDESPLFDLLAPSRGVPGTVGVVASMSGALDVLPLVVRHSAPQWEPWHTFAAGEGARVSGRRFRVITGAAPAGGPAVAGEELRWKGVAAVGFVPAFPPEGVDLRVVDGSTGDVLHARRFLSSSRYAPLDTRLVRAADGTAFCLLPVGGAPFTDTPIRLSFTFRRDNQAVVADSLVLRQDGERLEEIAVVDIG